MIRPPPISTLFPYTTLFRSFRDSVAEPFVHHHLHRHAAVFQRLPQFVRIRDWHALRQALEDRRSEEHTSELQSHHDLVCRLLLEKKKKHKSSTLNKNSNHQS